MKTKLNEYLGMRLVDPKDRMRDDLVSLFQSTLVQKQVNEHQLLPFLSALGNPKFSPYKILIDTPSPKDVVSYLKEKKGFIDDIFSNHYNHFLISANAQEIADTVKVNKNFNYRLLSTLKPQKSCYLLNESECFRFYTNNKAAKDKGLTILYLKAENVGNKEKISYETFSVSYERGIITIDTIVERQTKLLLRLIKLIIFVEMSDPELLFIPAGNQVDVKKDGHEQIQNQTLVPITRVHSHWNKFVIRTEAIAVKGFLRLQACGPQYSQRRLTWVNAHSRNGFVRKPKT